MDNKSEVKFPNNICKIRQNTSAYYACVNNFLLIFFIDIFLSIVVKFVYLAVTAFTVENVNL